MGEFPRQMPVPLSTDHYSELEDTIKFFDLNDQTDSILICEKRQKLYIRLKDEINDDFISTLSFNPKAMKETHHGNLIKGVSITKISDKKGIDFVSRYFAPWNGIDEDPVNGSSHTNLTPYWANILGKDKLTSKMLSSRSGVLELVDQADKNTVLIGGNGTL